jgi:hypothetical protein
LLFIASTRKLTLISEEGKFSFNNSLMLLLSNLGGINFRLAQNRKGLTFKSRKHFAEPISENFDFSNAQSESDFFNSFLNENKEFLSSNGIY